MHSVVSLSGTTLSTHAMHLFGPDSVWQEVGLFLQGMLVTEMWMDRVARMTDQPLQNVRQLNLYKEKERTHFGQILHGSQVQVMPPYRLGLRSQNHGATAASSGITCIARDRKTQSMNLYSYLAASCLCQDQAQCCNVGVASHCIRADEPPAPEASYFCHDLRLAAPGH